MSEQLGLTEGELSTIKRKLLKALESVNTYNSKPIELQAIAQVSMALIQFDKHICENGGA